MAIAIKPELEEEHLEVCPSCGKMMKAGQYICKSCHRQPNAPMVLVADSPEFRPKKYNKTALTDSICGNCPKLIPCGERVMNGGRCFCEIPCEDDLLIGIASRISSEVQNEGNATV